MDFAGAYTWINIRFLLEGLLLTLKVALVASLFSFIIGAVLGLIRYLKIPVLSVIVGAVIDIIRNLPLLLIIFFTYFALPQIGIRLTIFWSAVAALTIFESAMLSEIIRGGLNSIPIGQTEAGVSTGLTYGQTLWYIVIPQALRAMVPPIVSQIVSLIKDTSLATIITLPELTHHVRIVYGQNTNYVIPMFIMMGLLYWIVCYSLSRFSKKLEKVL
ncbi:amino acid ABC transporter permease [Jeotgalibaca ciconiae]|uniref:Amino acid ABC transporter permease n=1 Tax=Jeotgalibaca ciconiae TaxID=2496265 RepID=A0A3S9H9S1_9LACT|nr:amino acid ABC transporter permease [Jeotgalibaca ciconiae]AZP04077.1 amino acid ABC transporter permease [Jeotgalibaca ciconiae]HJB22964.1 amino acid ABC transporter permease [Candidatus Jeotgalibaca pullicola]